MGLLVVFLTIPLLTPAAQSNRSQIHRRVYYFSIYHWRIWQQFPDSGLVSGPSAAVSARMAYTVDMYTRPTSSGQSKDHNYWHCSTVIHMEQVWYIQMFLSQWFVFEFFFYCKELCINKQTEAQVTLNHPPIVVNHIYWELIFSLKTLNTTWLGWTRYSCFWYLSS